MSKLTPRSKKMAIVIYILLFTVLPYRWGTQHSASLTEAIDYSKSQIQTIENKLASLDAQQKLSPLVDQVNSLRTFVPNDASLPTFIPIIASAGSSAGMFLTSGSPEKSNTNISSSQSTLSDAPTGTNSYLMTVSFTGPSANLPRLLDTISNMNRSVSIDSFVTQPGASPGLITVNMTLKFYSIRVN